MIRVLLLLLLAQHSLLFAQDSEFDLIDRRDEARGAFLATPQGIYGHYCAHCHGDDGRGNGRLWTTDLSPRPSDLVASRLDEAALAAFISKGSAAAGRSGFCPPWERTLSPANIKRLTGHLVSLRGAARPAPPDNRAGPGDLRQDFPWMPAGVVLAELGVLVWVVVRRRKEVPDLVPQDTPGRR